jgi:tripartite-type tricarboxylate transporter receptor subunit TctC
MKIKFNLLTLVMIGSIFILLLSACGSTSVGTNSENSNSTSKNESKEATSENKSEEAQVEKIKFPEHEVTIIVPNKAGGSNDLVARSITRELQEILGVPVVVKNVDGAGGSIARAQVYRENPDGYTIITSPMPSMSIGELVKGDDFKVLDFEPIYNLFGNNSSVIAVPMDSPIKTYEDLIALSSKKKLVASGTGAATNSTLASIILKETGLDHQYVPFKGDAGASTQVAGGHVDFGLISEAGAQPLVKDGVMRVIAYLGKERSDLYPDATTLVELGHEEAYFEIIYGFFAPPGTPKEIIEVLDSAFAEASQKATFKEFAANAGFKIKTMNASEFDESIVKIHRRVEEFKELFELK